MTDNGPFFDETGAAVCFDPRDPEQELGDIATHKRTRNPMLVLAHSAMLAFPHLTVDWPSVARGADICDEPIDARSPFAR